MAPSPDTASPRVVIAEDRNTATLCVPPEMPRDQLTLSFCKSVLKDHGVECTAAVNEAVARLLHDLPPEGQPIEAVIATGTDPEHGEDGHIEWFVESAEQDVELSFYHRCPYIMVEAGQILGRVHEPTPGHDGRDVTGGTRAAKPGRSVGWTFNDSILRNARGELVAQKDGMLIRAGHKARISQVLEINDSVDFSTGHIDFDGDVIVYHEVRDRFEVKATGTVEVHGLIEAATIRCGRDLVAKTGMAGREIGEAHVGGDLIARYLDNITGWVVGRLAIEREVINTRLTVEGDIEIPDGSVIGGRLVCGAKVRAAAIGSRAGVPTKLVLGVTPGPQKKLTQLEQVIEQAQQRREALLEEQQRLRDSKAAPDASSRERETELAFNLQQVDQMLARAAKGRKILQQRINAQWTVDVEVAKALYHGVQITVGSDCYEIREDIKGPARIMIGSDGTPHCQQGSTHPQPLINKARLRDAA